jgi:hypothetical protein
MRKPVFQSYPANSSHHPVSPIVVPKCMRYDRLLTGKGFTTESVPNTTGNRYILLAHPVDGWLGIFALTLITGVLVIVGQGKLLQYIFPGMAIFVGLYLYQKHLILYSGFVWWLWFLSAFVRRLADYGSGFTEPNPILLAPFLVSLISVMSLIKALPRSGREDHLPFTLAFISIVYAFFIGVINFPIADVIVSSLEWFSPVVFGYHLFSQWKEYLSYRQHIYRVFLIATLVTGFYGIYQYLVAPEWDRIWLIGTAMVSAGSPEPQEMRVWSTMHSHGVFASTIMAGLLLLFRNIYPLGLLASGVGYLSFLLSMARTAWLGWTFGLLSLIVNVNSKLRLRLFLFIGTVSLVVVPLSQVEPFSNIITARISTFSDIQNDASALDRQQLYSEGFNQAITNIIGDGLHKGVGVDSGFISMLLALGLIGTTCYLGAMLLLFFKLERSPFISHDWFASTAKAIAYGTAIQLLSGAVMLGLPGTVMWGFIGLALAGHKYYSEQDRLTTIAAMRTEDISS